MLGESKAFSGFAVPDVAKAQQTLGYLARVPLDVGLGRTLDWCRTTYRVSLAS